MLGKGSGRGPEPAGGSSPTHRMAVQSCSEAGAVYTGIWWRHVLWIPEMLFSPACPAALLCFFSLLLLWILCRNMLTEWAGLSSEETRNLQTAKSFQLLKMAQLWSHKFHTGIPFLMAPFVFIVPVMIPLPVQIMVFNHFDAEIIFGLRFLFHLWPV